MEDSIDLAAAIQNNLLVRRTNRGVKQNVFF
jgi:hypothetical protein